MIRKDIALALVASAAGTLAGTVLSLFLVTSAHAGPANAWSGCYLGAGVSYDSLTGSGVGADGYGGSPFLGCDIQRDRLVFGVWGDYGWNRFKSSGNSIDDQGWAAGGRAGVLVTKDVLAYGLVGYTMQTAKASGMSVDLRGMEYGGGFEVDLGKGWFTQLEGKYEPLDVTNSGGFSVKNEEVRLGVLYKFNLIGFKDVEMPTAVSKPLK